MLPFWTKLGMTKGWGVVGDADPFLILLKNMFAFPISSLDKFSGVRMKNFHVENDFFIFISFFIYLF